MAVGVDGHDLVELKSRGIRLGHTPGVLTDSVVRVKFDFICFKSILQFELIIMFREDKDTKLMCA